MASNPTRGRRSKRTKNRGNGQGPFGYILTVKRVPRSDYMTIHTAPHGTRQDIMLALLAAATAFVKKNKKTGLERLALGKIRLA